MTNLPFEVLHPVRTITHDMFDNGSKQVPPLRSVTVTIWY